MSIDTSNTILTDAFGRKHTYLRISLTERCNLRCTYCMPKEGVPLLPSKKLMTCDEIIDIASQFVRFGVTKIRLTGGEPLVRKDASHIISALGRLPAELVITTNGVLVDRFLDTFRKAGIKKVNVSLDSLQENKNEKITRRNYFQRVYQNIQLLLQDGFEVKVNCVLIKGFNDDEIIDFIKLGEEYPLQIRFIEFMPFDGNRWNRDQLVSYQEIMQQVHWHWTASDIIRLQDADHDTAKNYKIGDSKGSFAIISSVTNPFCDGCNRIRLTADGQLKNCLFSSKESDLLSVFRSGNSIEPLIQKIIQQKKRVRAGMDTSEKFNDLLKHSENRSMITIGG